jgi:hypothetical protein
VLGVPVWGCCTAPTPSALTFNATACSRGSELDHTGTRQRFDSPARRAPASRHKERCWRDAGSRPPPGDCESGGHERETRHGRSARPRSAYAEASRERLGGADAPRPKQRRDRPRRRLPLAQAKRAPAALPLATSRQKRASARGTCFRRPACSRPARGDRKRGEPVVRRRRRLTPQSAPERSRDTRHREGEAIVTIWSATGHPVITTPRRL